MPILFMALIALAVFLIMGAMVFYAAYAESHTPETAELHPPPKGEAPMPNREKAPVPGPVQKPAVPRAARKAAGGG